MAYWNNKLGKDSITYISHKFKKVRYFTFYGKEHFLDNVFDNEFNKNLRWVRSGKLLGRAATYTGV